MNPLSERTLPPLEIWQQNMEALRSAGGIPCPVMTESTTRGVHYFGAEICTCDRQKERSKIIRWGQPCWKKEGGIPQCLVISTPK